jgi:hypothetical protein
MFSNSHILNVHEHGWWGWHATCGALGRVWTMCVGALSRKLCEGGHRDHKSVCGRRLCVPACVQPMFSGIYICRERAHV